MSKLELEYIKRCLHVLHDELVRLSIYNRTWLSRLAENSLRCYVRLRRFESQSDKYWSSNYRKSHGTPPPQLANFDLGWMEEKEKGRERGKKWRPEFCPLADTRYEMKRYNSFTFIFYSAFSLSWPLFPVRFIQRAIFFTFFEKITYCVYDIYWINVSRWHKDEKSSKSSSLKNYWQAKNFSLEYLKLMWNTDFVLCYCYYWK